RRRHTRFSRDWSSDVCSSDLKNAAGLPWSERILLHSQISQHSSSVTVPAVARQDLLPPTPCHTPASVTSMHTSLPSQPSPTPTKIGRAACRDRGKRRRRGLGD